MHVRMQILLLCSFLLTGVGCNSKSVTTQQNTQNGQTSTTQQTVNVSNTAVSEQNSNANAATTSNANAATASNANAAAATSDGAKSGACGLISSKEIKEVQGEAVADATGSERDSGGLLSSQCFYRLPTFNKSVSLETTSRSPSSTAPNPVKEFWKEKFGGAEGKASPPQPVKDLGDEAFWVGSRINITLYVLKNNTIIRISIGGPDEQAIKIQKSKQLAQQVIKRL